MVKTKVKDKRVKSENYPRLKTSNDGDVIILFNSPTAGMVVHSKNTKSIPVGTYSENLNNVMFSDFDSVIKINNS